MEDKHANEPKEKENKKMASYICDWIGKEGRNEVKHGEEKVWSRVKTAHIY